MRQLYLNRAIAEAVAQEMKRDERVVLIGEDIINRGGGDLAVTLYNSTPEDYADREAYAQGKPGTFDTTPVTVTVDGTEGEGETDGFCVQTETAETEEEDENGGMTTPI